MGTNEPKVEAVGRYDTKRTCKELGISRSTLERYRKAGLLKPKYHKANMRPYYVGADVLKLWHLMM